MPFAGTDNPCAHVFALSAPLGGSFPFICMPIILPDDFPDTDTLKSQGIPVIHHTDAVRQDIRPLLIGVLNTMPNAQQTELDFLRMFAHDMIQIQPVFVRTDTFNGSAEVGRHLMQSSKTFDEIQHTEFDAFMTTGANQELGKNGISGNERLLKPFEDVSFWKEYVKISCWMREKVQTTFHSCWSAMAELYIHHGIQNQLLPKKKLGVFMHQLNNQSNPLTKNFDNPHFVPVARNTEIQQGDIDRVPDLVTLSASEETGPYIVQSTNRRHTYVFNHAEYSEKALGLEYERDQKAGLELDPLEGYHIDNDPKKGVNYRWASLSRVFMDNWMNGIYQRISRPHAQKSDSNASQIEYHI